MNANSLMPLIVFVLALISAILIGNFFITKFIGIPVNEAPALLKVVVHGATLGIVFYVGAKFFSSK